MLRFGALLPLALGLATTAPLWAQQTETKTLWICKDKDGRSSLTSEKQETVGKDCRVSQESRVTVVPATKSGAKPPAGFPRESTTDRATARSKQRETIERELSQEEQLLNEAKRKLAAQEATRSGDEKNYAKVLERLQPYKDAVEVHEKNIAALRREISNLR